MPKRLGSYYVCNAALFAKAVMPGIPSTGNLQAAHKANHDAKGETLVVYVPRNAIAKTEQVTVEKTVQEDWSP